MKKRWLLLLLVPLLAITMISCDPEARGKLASTMDKFGSNVYLDSGLVEKNLADADAAAATISNLGSGEAAKTVEGGKVTIFGDIEVDNIEASKTLEPQKKDDQTKLKDNLADAFNSPQQKDELKKKMGEKITDEDQKEAVKGTVEVINKTIDLLVGDDSDADDALKDAVAKLKIPEIDEDELTAGDLLLVQMMTNLISNTLTTFSDLEDDIGDMDEEEGFALLLPIIDDALFTAQVAEELSGAASIDFTGQLDLMSLLSGLGEGDDGNGDDDEDKGVRKGLFSRESGTEGDDADDVIPEEFMGMIEDLGTDIVGLMGLKKEADGTYDWDKGDYRSFMANQRTYRGSLEYALSLAGKKSLADISEFFDSSTAIKYLLSVIFTEVDEWGKQDGVALVGEERAGRYLLRTLIWAILEDPEAFEDGETFEVDPETFVEFIVVEKGEVEVRGIFENTLKINSIGGIEMLSDLIDDFLNKKGDDGKTEFDKFWANLTESDSDN